MFKTKYGDIRCTENHKFFDQKEFKPIGSFTKEDDFTYLPIKDYLKCLRQTLLSTKELNLEDIPTQIKDICKYIIGRRETIGKTGLGHYIKKFGKRITDLYPKGMQFITKMVIRWTMELKIWNAFLSVIICATTQTIDCFAQYLEKQILKTLRWVRKKPSSGTKAKKAISGTQPTVTAHGPKESPFQKHVLFVTGYLKRLILKKQLSFVLGHVSQNTGALKVWMTKKGYVLFAAQSLSETDLEKQKHVLTNALTSLESERSSKVYNLTVENHHEYYANGLLVSNCDALRYATSRIPWDFSRIDVSAQEAKITKNSDDLITNPRERFYKGLDKPESSIDLVEAEFDEVNEAYDYYGYD